MTFTRGMVGLALALALLGASSLARADGSDRERAVVAFEEARKMIAAGDCEGGIAKLEQSLRYEPSIGARLSMADCYETRDPLVAWTNLREAERLSYVKQDERRKVAHDRAAALEAKLPIVKVNISEAVLNAPGLELRVDGELVDPFFYSSGTLAMKPGPHVVEATIPSKRWSQDVVAQPGATTSVTVQLQDAPAGRPAPPPIEGPPPGQTQRTIGLVIAGVGVASLVAGGAFGLAALTEKNDIEKSCGGSAASCMAMPGSLDGAKAQQQSFALLSTVGFIAGGTLLAGGLFLYVIAPKANAPRVGMAVSWNSVVLKGSW